MNDNQRKRFEYELRSLLKNYGIVTIQAPIKNSLIGFNQNGDGVFHIDLEACSNKATELRVEHYDTF